MKNKKSVRIIIILLFIVALSFIGIQLNRKLERKEVFSIKDKDFYLYESNVYGVNEEYRGVKLLEYDNSNNDYAEIYYILYDYTTEPSFYYSVQITDESNNNLLLSEATEDEIICGVVSSVKIKKVSLSSKINLSVFEKNENKIVNKAQVKIDLNNDLEDTKKIDLSSNMVEAKLGDIKFKYINYEDVYYGTTEHAYSENLVVQTYSIPIKIQYGNRLISKEYIDFSCEKNVNNLSLEDAFESLALITENFGQYGLSDLYGLDIDKSEEQEIIVVTFDEMVKLCKGLSIKKDGKEYTKDSFDKFAEMPYKKDKDLNIGNGIKAIKYIYELDKNYEYYMFICNDNIYYITIPTEPALSAEMQQLLKSIEEI